ncbi:hypothetical protein NU195Hw_Modified_17t1 [Hortaea werneckii]
MRDTTVNSGAGCGSATDYCQDCSMHALSRAQGSISESKGFNNGCSAHTNSSHDEAQSPLTYGTVGQPHSYHGSEEKDSRSSSESVITIRYAPKEASGDREAPSRHEPRHGFSRKQSLASLTRKFSGLLGHDGSLKNEAKEELESNKPSRRKLSRKLSLPQFRKVRSLRKGNRTHEAEDQCSKVSYLAPSLKRPDRQDRAELWSRSLSQDLLDFKGLDADKEVSTASYSGLEECERRGRQHRQEALNSSQRSGPNEQFCAQPPRLRSTLDTRTAEAYGNHASSAVGASSLTDRVNAPVSTPPQLYELENRTTSAGTAQKRMCSIDAAYGWEEARDSGVAKSVQQSRELPN